MVKFFIDPFAVDGDLTPVPNPVQPGGVVSYTEGYGFNYQRNLLTDPAALAIGRQQMNALFNDITTALQQYQTTSVPDWITSSDNGGTPFPYGQYVRVTYDDGVNGPRVFESKINDNTDAPTVPESWRWVDNNAGTIMYDDVSFDGAVSDGDAVYFNSGTGNYTQAVADGSVAENLIGIADVTNSRVLAFGIVIGLLGGLTPGAIYYLSGTVPGALTAIVPTGSIIRAGIAASATELLLNINIISTADTSIVPIGTSLDFRGFNIPAGFLPEDGSAVSRVTYANLFSVISSTLNCSTTNGSPNITFPVASGLFPGVAVTGAGIPVGTTVSVVTSSTSATLSQNATATATTPLIFYKYGAGNGSTTFNLPDSRGFTSVGDNGPEDSILGNVAGMTGGTRTVSLTGAQNGPHDHTGSTITLDPHTHTNDPHGHPGSTGEGSNNNEGDGFIEGQGDTGTNYPLDIAENTVVIDDTIVTGTVSIVESGTGAAHNNMQPSLVVRKMIKY